MLRFQVFSRVFVSVWILNSTGFTFAQSGSLFRDPNGNATPPIFAEQIPAPVLRPDASLPILPPGQAGWDANNPLRAASWTAIPPLPARALKIHDIVSIRVDESATTNTQGSAQSRKTTSLDAKLSDWVRLVGIDTVKPAKQADGDQRVAGQESEVYRASSTLQTREQMTFNIAAEIADIRPNGLLVLSARKKSGQNDNSFEVSLSGVCRPQDVGPDNVVLSRDIFELQVSKNDQGHVRDGISRGWLTRWYARFKPF